MAAWSAVRGRSSAVGSLPSSRHNVEERTIGLRLTVAVV